MSNYFFWEIEFDKVNLKWGELKSYIKNVPGNSKWVSQDFNKKCIFTFHEKHINSKTLDLSEIGHPGIPHNKYCRLKFAVWRINDFKVFPELIGFSNNQGSNIWRKVTPFEYELTQSTSHLKNEHPPFFSFENIEFKNDGFYREFHIFYVFINNSIIYYSGPFFIRSIENKGSGEWFFDGESFLNSFNNRVFKLIWVSNDKGLTSPSNSPDSETLEMIEEHAKLFNENVDEDNVNNIPVFKSSTSISFNDTSVFLNFSIKYNLSTNKLFDLSIDSKVRVDYNSINRDNSWHIYQFEDNICILKFFSSMKFGKIDDDSKYFDALSKVPMPSQNVLDRCKSESLNVLFNDYLFDFDIIELTVSKIIYEGSELNKKYFLYLNSDFVWESEGIELNFKESIGTLSFNKGFNGNSLNIYHNIDTNLLKAQFGRIFYSNSANYFTNQVESSCSLLLEFKKSLSTSTSTSS